MTYGNSLSPFHYESAQHPTMGANIPRGMPVMIGKKLSWWKWWNKEIKWSLSEWGLIRGGDIVGVRLPIEYGSVRPYDELNNWSSARGQAQWAAGN